MLVHANLLPIRNVIDEIMTYTLFPWDLIMIHHDQIFPKSRHIGHPIIGTVNIPWQHVYTVANHIHAILPKIKKSS